MSAPNPSAAVATAATPVAKSAINAMSKMTGSQIIQMVLLLLTVVGIGVVVWQSTLMTGDPNNLAEVQKKMGIIVGVTFAIVLMLGIFTYLYIRSQPDMFVPFVIIMLFSVLEISLIAVGGSVLQRIV